MQISNIALSLITFWCVSYADFLQTHIFDTAWQDRVSIVLFAPAIPYPEAAALLALMSSWLWLRDFCVSRSITASNDANWKSLRSSAEDKRVTFKQSFPIRKCLCQSQFGLITSRQNRRCINQGWIQTSATSFRKLVRNLKERKIIFIYYSFSC